MQRPTIIAPSILSADFTHLGAQLAEAEAGGQGWVHIDVMDGQFVPNITMGSLIVEACKQATTLPLDVHLMVEHPEKHIASFAKAGADRITVHTEASPNLHRTLQSIRDLGCLPGAAINPGTPSQAVFPILSTVEMILVMTVNPGYGGQSFIPEVTTKIEMIRTWLDDINPQAMIQVDGGISPATIRQAYDSGAQIFVAGNAVYNHPDGIGVGIKALRDKLE